MVNLKSKIVLLSCFSIILTHSCTSQSKVRNSVKEFNCHNAKVMKHVIPSTPNITMYPENCKDYIFNAARVSQVIHIFVEEYSSEFGISELLLWEMLKNLEIQVSAIPKTVKSAFDKNGKMLKNPYVSGLALSKSKIWVEVRTSQIWSSSLIHELVHIIIWHLNDVHGDPDHEGTEYSGWTKKHSNLIKRINNKLLDMEL